MGRRKVWTFGAAVAKIAPVKSSPAKRCCWVATLALACSWTACGGAGRARRPYRFGQGMIDTPDPLDSPKRNQARQRNRRRTSTPQHLASWREAVANRAQKLVGATLAGSRAEATRRLLRLALGRDPGPLARVCAGARVDGPRPGDLICFDPGRGTDRQRRRGRAANAAGVVIEASPKEIVFVYLSGPRVRRGVLNEQWPHQRRVGNRIVNSYVRVKTPTDPPQTVYLAAELLSGFATVRP